MKVKNLTMKRLVHLATISCSVGVALVCIAGFSTRLDANPAPTNQRASSPRKPSNLPNVGSPKRTVGLGTRGAGNNETSDTPARTEGSSVEAAASTNPTDNLLAKWGWTRTKCQQGAVFITGISAETVCVNSTSDVRAGQYTYNPATNKLIPLNSQPVNSQPVNSKPANSQPANSQPQPRQSPSNRIF